jgi:hypothetical protein
VNFSEKELFSNFIPRPISNSKKVKFILENEKKDYQKKKKIFITFKKTFYFHEKLFGFVCKKKEINETIFIKDLWKRKFERKYLKF